MGWRVCPLPWRRRRGWRRGAFGPVPRLRLDLMDTDRCVNRERLGWFGLKVKQSSGCELKLQHDWPCRCTRTGQSGRTLKRLKSFGGHFTSPHHVCRWPTIGQCRAEQACNKAWCGSAESTVDGPTVVSPTLSTAFQRSPRMVGNRTAGFCKALAIVPYGLWRGTFALPKDYGERAAVATRLATRQGRQEAPDRNFDRTKALPCPSTRQLCS